MSISPGPWKLSLVKAKYTVPEYLTYKLEQYGLPTEFEAMSVGCANGIGPQVAIIPLDESSEENGYIVAASLEMYDALLWVCTNQCTRGDSPEDKHCDDQLIHACPVKEAYKKARGEGE